MNDHPYDQLLNAEPAPPMQLAPLLRYLSDAFALLDDWIRQPDEDDPIVLGIGKRRKTAGNGETTLQVVRRSHLSSAGDNGEVRLLHPADENGRPRYEDTYERNDEGATELMRDISLHATERTEARSQWNTWARQHLARTPEEIRIALQNAPGYYVQCPLDAYGKPMHVVATLETVLEGEDPAGPRTREVAINVETQRLLERLASCVEPLP